MVMELRISSIGAPLVNNSAGAAYVIFGKHNMVNSMTIQLSDLNGLSGFRITGNMANQKNNIVSLLKKIPSLLSKDKQFY